MVATFVAYTLTRNNLPAHATRAREYALDLYRLERRLHLDVERTVNDAVAGSASNPFSTVANYLYATSHWGVTMTVLVWLYVARPRVYAPARTALLLTTLLGLLGYWLVPLAPPRFFPRLGFVDTVVRDHMWGSWGTAPVTELSNEYAAMPSMHAAWSIWCAVVVALWARRTWVRVAALCYPVVVLVVILGTANHWLLHAVAGLVVVAAGAGLTVAAGRAPGLRPPRTPTRRAARPSP